MKMITATRLDRKSGFTRICYLAALATTTGAVSRKGKRMKMINATRLDRKSGFTRRTETPSRIPATARECCGKRKPHCGRRWLG